MAGRAAHAWTMSPNIVLPRDAAEAKAEEVATGERTGVLNPE